MPVSPEEFRAKNSALISDVMDAKGMTDDMLMDILKEELGAIETKVSHKKQILAGEDPFDYSKDLIAHEPRLRALELSFRLKGHLVERKHHTFEKPLPVVLTEEQELEVKAKMEVLKGKKDAGT
jgi:DNA polymerase III psi subunit